MRTHSILNQYKNDPPNFPKYNNVCSCGFFFLGTQERVRIAVVNEPSVFEQLKFYFIFFLTLIESVSLFSLRLTDFNDI